MKQKQPIMEWIRENGIPNSKKNPKEYSRWNCSREKKLLERFYNESRFCVEYIALGHFSREEQIIIRALLAYINQSAQSRRVQQRKTQIRKVSPIMEWIRANGRIPDYKNEKIKYQKWCKSWEKKLADRYFDEGKQLESFAEEDQAIIKELTEKYGYAKKQAISPIIEWIRANGRIPNYKSENAKFQQWSKSMERELVDRYFDEGKHIEKFTEEQQAVIRELTEKYGYVKKQKPQPIMEWIRANGIPNSVDNPTIYARWYKSKERKIVDRYFIEGEHLESFTEEQQAVIRELTEKYGYKKRGKRIKTGDIGKKTYDVFAMACRNAQIVITGLVEEQQPNIEDDVYGVPDE